MVICVRSKDLFILWNRERETNNENIEFQFNGDFELFIFLNL